MNKLEAGCLYFIIAVAALIGYGFGSKTVKTEETAIEDVVEEIVETTSEEAGRTTMETTTTTVTTTVSTIVTSVTESTTTETVTDFKDDMTYLGSYTATYYKGDGVPCYGGSGRMLVSCYEKDEWYKGSVASRWVHGQYGYDLNGKTTVYIEFDNYPRLNGWYSVDDYNADPGIVDFYFADYSTCPWQNDGVTGCRMWISVPD